MDKNQDFGMSGAHNGMSARNCSMSFSSSKLIEGRSRNWKLIIDHSQFSESQ